MLDEPVVGLIPYLLPIAYLLGVAVIHFLFIVKPSAAMLAEERRQPGQKTESVAFSQAKILAGWRTLHRDQVAQVKSLEREDVIVQLRTRLPELPDDNRSRAVRVAATEALTTLTKESATAADLDGAKRVLEQVLRIAYDSRDSVYEEAADVHRKTLWLATLAAALVAALGAALQEGEAFFLVGAVGGLVSRLNRVLSRRPRANDYGASWSTLILAPIAGALAGWLGVLLTEALASDFGVFDEETFTAIFSGGEDLPADRATLALAVAFVFGFSERLINRAAATAEDRIVPRLPETPSGRAGDAGGAQS